MYKAYKLLTALTQQFPPREGAQHSFTLGDGTVWISLELPEGRLHYALAPAAFDWEVETIIDQLLYLETARLASKQAAESVTQSGG